MNKASQPKIKGPFFPYVIGVRDQELDGHNIRTWILVGGELAGELQFQSYENAEQAAEALLSKKQAKEEAARDSLLNCIERSRAAVLARNQREWSRFAAQRSSIR